MLWRGWDIWCSVKPEEYGRISEYNEKLLFKIDFLLSIVRIHLYFFYKCYIQKLKVECAGMLHAANDLNIIAFIACLFID